MTAELSPQVQKFLRKAERLLYERLRDRIRKLEQEPFPQDCESIKGKENTFRVRVGDYRIIYEPGDSLLIIRIDKRETVYL